ncbi:hypothetical protein D3C72_1421990 [compost metagenome]
MPLSRQAASTWPLARPTRASSLALADSASRARPACSAPAVCRARSASFPCAIGTPNTMVSRVPISSVIWPPQALASALACWRQRARASCNGSGSRPALPSSRLATRTTAWRSCGSAAITAQAGGTAAPSSPAAAMPATGSRRARSIAWYSASVSGSGDTPSSRCSAARHKRYCLSASACRPWRSYSRISVRCTSSCNGSRARSRVAVAMARSVSPACSWCASNLAMTANATPRRRSRSIASQWSNAGAAA